MYTHKEGQLQCLLGAHICWHESAC